MRTLDSPYAEKPEGQIGSFRPNCQTLAKARRRPKAKNGERYVSRDLVCSYRASVGVIVRSVIHVHLTLFWTIVLGIVGSIIGGGVAHMFSRPRSERYHPAEVILSTLGAIFVLSILL